MVIGSGKKQIDLSKKKRSYTVNAKNGIDERIAEKTKMAKESEKVSKIRKSENAV